MVSTQSTNFLFPVISVFTWTKLRYRENGCGKLAQNVGGRKIIIQHNVSTPEYRILSNIWRVNIIISISTFVFRRRNRVFRIHFNIILPWTTRFLKWSLSFMVSSPILACVGFTVVPRVFCSSLSSNPTLRYLESNRN